MKNSLVKTRAYFDCNATTPVLPIAAQAALETMKTLYGNPSSAHLVGLQARQILETTRSQAAQVIGAEPEQIIFTSGATEAIQTAVFSALLDCRKKNRVPETRILYSATEHKVVPEALRHWIEALQLPYSVIELPVDAEGKLELDVLERELPHAALLCTMAVNNETGVIQDLSAIQSLLDRKKSNILWLVDCVQALGKIPLFLKSMRVDYAALSGHKLYAPKGIGFLYVKKESPFTPLIVGGGQEKGLRSGTENLPGVAALGSILEELLKGDQSTLLLTHQQLTELREKLRSQLQSSFPKIVFNTPFKTSVPTTLNFSIPGLSSLEILSLFDSAGLRVSAGSACSSQSTEPSHVLTAMGFPLWRSTSALRLSFGPGTTREEIEQGCRIIRDSAIALKNTCLLETPRNFEAPESLREGLIQFRASSSNSWLLADRETRTAILIDPCESNAERWVQYVRCQNLKLLAILDTHGHGDHESSRPLLQKTLRSYFVQSTDQGESDSLGWPISASNFLITIHLENGQNVPAIRFSGPAETPRVLARIPIPGHTRDSHAYLFGELQDGTLKKEKTQFAFIGDTILSGGLGRTNFDISDPEGLFHSLRKLQSVTHNSTLLCPAHDYNDSFASLLKTEVDQNPLLALALGPLTPLSLPEFLRKKAQIDSELSQLEENFQGVVCGVTPMTSAPEGCQISIPSESLLQYIQTHHPLIIDVREPQEFLMFKDWSLIGLETPPRNVPLSRFVNWMSELLRTKALDQEILLICRSGARSFQAAKSLRRMGFSRAWNVSGGLAITS